MSPNIKRPAARTRAVDNYQFHLVLPSAAELTAVQRRPFQPALMLVLSLPLALLRIPCPHPLGLHGEAHSGLA